jgi:hypothetical protein
MQLTKNADPDAKKMREYRLQKIQEKKRKRKDQNSSDMQIAVKQHCLDIELTHAYLSSSHGMVSFTSEYIQHLKETYTDRS